TIAIIKDFPGIWNSYWKSTARVFDERIRMRSLSKSVRTTDVCYRTQHRGRVAPSIARNACVSMLSNRPPHSACASSVSSGRNGRTFVPRHAQGITRGLHHGMALL
ncbi:hypothetical protein KGP84_10470, partial [Burkholderia multivorans]|uniref:hypothetical protein n=1 Tax=Burkholderia multivorans TaxID=87883 RepID=UPI00209FA04F